MPMTACSSPATATAPQGGGLLRLGPRVIAGLPSAPVDDKVWTVPLPRSAEPPYRVFVNGVPQHEGIDYELRGHALAFPRHLEKEGRLGFWRWTAMFLALFGTYRKNDSVDVEYTVGGQRRLAVALDIVPPAEGKPAAGS